jgi:hypothetical protein
MLGIAKPQTKNLIEVFSAGYRVLTERLWVLVIPVVLDLLFWLTPQVVVTPILEPLRADLDAAAIALTSTPEQQQELVQSMLATDIRQILPFNYVPLYIVPLADAATAPKISLTSPLGALATIGLLNGVLLVLSALFLAVLGREIQPTRYPERGRVASVLHISRAMAGYVLTLLLLALVVGLPFALGAAVAAQTLPGLVPLLVVVAGIMWFWVIIYTGFTIEAIVIHEVGVLRGIIYSLRLVQRHFWSAFGLLAISALIITGFGVLWSWLAQSTLGILATVLASAYVGAGLAAARLVFVAERSAPHLQTQTS